MELDFPKTRNGIAEAAAYLSHSLWMGTLQTFQHPSRLLFLPSRHLFVSIRHPTDTKTGTSSSSDAEQLCITFLFPPSLRHEIAAQTILPFLYSSVGERKRALWITQFYLLWFLIGHAKTSQQRFIDTSQIELYLGARINATTELLHLATGTIIPISSWEGG